MLLTYCSNIHPVESWGDVRSSLERHAPKIRASVCPNEPFPLGIWLSERAVAGCEAEGPESFGAWCEANGCYVLTLNGFPMERFHGTTIKQRVYRPDWRSARRVDYTRRLATLLDHWLPGDRPGSISTVPVGWGPEIEVGDLPHVHRNLRAVLEHLDRLRQRSGKQILLALEPEPGCHLQTTGDLLAFFEALDLPPPLRPLLGLCYDTCHQAVLYEDPLVSLRTLERAGIPIAKVQASSALRLEGNHPACLRAFCDDGYLHQTVLRTAGGLQPFDDLPGALDGHAGLAREWRVHVHVPVFLEHLGGGLATTRPFLEQVLAEVGGRLPVEVETYTFSVLPPELQSDTLEQSIIRELLWVRDRCREAEERER